SKPRDIKHLQGLFFTQAFCLTKAQSFENTLRGHRQREVCQKLAGGGFRSGIHADELVLTSPWTSNLYCHLAAGIIRGAYIDTQFAIASRNQRTNDRRVDISINRLCEFACCLWRDGGGINPRHALR